MNITDQEGKQWYGSVKYLADDLLTKNIADTERLLQELRVEVKRRESFTSTYRLARRLHDNLCDHRDCDWAYWDGTGTTPNNLAEPKMYMRMAAELEYAYDDNKENIEQLVGIFNKRK